MCISCDRTIPFLEIDPAATYIFQRWPRDYLPSHALFHSVTLLGPLQRQLDFIPPTLENTLGLILTDAE